MHSSTVFRSLLQQHYVLYYAIAELHVMTAVSKIERSYYCCPVFGVEVWVDAQAFLVLHYIAMRLLDQQISCGTYHTAAVTATGELLACGANDEGQVTFGHA
jgi:Regulator of chromosome condensation (RCC1) repeat